MKIKKTSAVPFVVAPSAGYPGGRFDGGGEFDVPDKVGRQLVRTGHFAECKTAPKPRPVEAVKFNDIVEEAR